MNILVLTNYQLYKDLTFSFIHNQVKAFAEQGHCVKVVIYTAIGQNVYSRKRIFSFKKENMDGAELIFLPYLSLSNFGESGFNEKSAEWFLKKYAKTIFKGFVPDVIYGQTIGASCNMGKWLKTKFFCPVVVTSHGSDAETPLSNGEGDRLRSYCDKADRIVAVSSKLADRVRSCGTKTPVSTILNGFVPRPYNEEIVRDSMRIIQVGNLIPQKKNDITIRAFCKLKNNYPKMHLTIIGDGPERQRLELLCEKLGVKDSVSFLGRLPNENVLQEMNKSQFFVMPSKPEGFGIVYLEAMASGCITIGTQGEGISDLIVSGENGFLVPADDVDSIVNVIDKALKDKTLSDKIIANAKKDVENLTWRDNAEKYVELFWRLKQ